MSKTVTELNTAAAELIAWLDCCGIESHFVEKVRKKLAEQPAQQDPVAIPDVEFMRQVLSVAIAGLYYHYKDDVLKVFSPNDLQNVADLSESLVSQQVEDIYKRAWDMLATPQTQENQS